MKKEQILIVGGGFAGIELARNLKNDIKNGLCEVTLVSSHGYFEYYPGVYRIMIGESPIQTKIHLSDILPKNVKIIEDIINKIDPQNNKVIGVSGEYSYDKLVLALGSVPNYFNIQGLENGVFNFKSTGDAVILRNHLHKLLLGAKNEISKDTYDRWHSTYSSTILSCKSALERLAKTENHAYTILQKNLDMLGNIKEIYIQANIIQKREFVKLVFDSNLYYQDGIYRTPTMIDSLSHNHLIMKEKGLLVCNKKRDDFSIIPSSGVAENRTRVQTSN